MGGCWILSILGSDEYLFFTPIPNNLYPCPVLNCPKYFESEELFPHLTEIHNTVIGGSKHRNFLECGETELAIFTPECSVWSPTILEKSGQKFYFETYREENGTW